MFHVLHNHVNLIHLLTNHYTFDHDYVRVVQAKQNIKLTNRSDREPFLLQCVVELDLLDGHYFPCQLVSCSEHLPVHALMNLVEFRIPFNRIATFNQTTYLTFLEAFHLLLRGEACKLEVRLRDRLTLTILTLIILCFWS